MNKIVLEDFNEGNDYYKINLAYLNKKQVEEIEALVSKWNPTDEDIKNCIGMCLTDANEQRFKDYGTNLKDCLAWLEKQTPVKFNDEKDERIRKEMIFYFTEEIPQCSIQEHADKMKEFIAWLEKQGEQKPTYMVKPKFKVGDWCIDNKDGVIFQIVKVLSNTYTYKTNEGKEYSCTHYSLENDAKLWTIQDAKDGDVLAGGDWVFIFRKFHINGFPKCHCHYDLTLKEFKVDTDSYMAGGGDNYPATKEQRELLFAKMKEAGYEWDANNLKVWHIEKKNMEDEKETTSENKFKEGDWIIYEDKGLREILKVTAPPDNEYICENLNGENRYLCNEDADDYTFWNINYVKPGDIIVFDSNNLTCIALIKNITYDYLKNEGKVDLWFSYFTDGYWEAWNGGTPYTNITSLIACNAKPANKERRDLLFKKMKEAGYEWNEEKKELKKVVQKHTWSAEDEKNLEGIIDEIEANKNDAPDYDLKTYDRFLFWLKTLKERIGE